MTNFYSRQNVTLSSGSFFKKSFMVRLIVLGEYWQHVDTL